MQGNQAITIDFPAAGVWSWFVQLGQGRAAFYSYTWLENLFGCRIVVEKGTRQSEFAVI